MKLFLNITLALLIGITYVCIISAIVLTKEYAINESAVKLFASLGSIAGLLGIGVLYWKDKLGYDQDNLEDE